MGARVTECVHAVRFQHGLFADVLCLAQECYEHCDTQSVGFVVADVSGLR